MLGFGISKNTNKNRTKGRKKLNMLDNIKQDSLEEIIISPARHLRCMFK